MRANRISKISKAFSFPVMCMFLLAAAILVHAPKGLGVGEPDIWWRLRNASDFLQHHSLATIDTYSFTAAGSHWTNFEWASDVLFYLAYRTAGLQGMLLLYSSAVVLIFTGVYYRSYKAGADWKDAAVATLGGICIGCVSLAPRPLLFGWVCLTGVLLVLDRFRETGKGLWLLPPIFAIWINLHGSWIYGMAVLSATIVAGLVDGQWGLVVASRWSSGELKRLLLAFGASFAALFANPFGYKLVLFPLSFFRMQAFMQYIDYWHSVDFNTWNGKLAMGLIFAVIAAALFSRKPWRLDEVLLIAFALWSGLSHVRFLDFAAIIAVPILAPRLHLFPPYRRELDKPWLNAGIMVIVVASLAFFFPSSVQLQQRINDEYPVSALNFLRQRHINGRTFSPAEFGGFVEWTSPELKSFVDGRAVFVENGVFYDSVSILTSVEPFGVLDKYNIEYVLVEPTWPLAFHLQHSEGWRLDLLRQCCINI